MKKAVSVFILTCILVGSFYAQSDNIELDANISFIQAGNENAGDYGYNKYLIFSEVSSEKEDNESRAFTDFYDTFVGGDLILFKLSPKVKNLKCHINVHNGIFSVPLFLKNRRILI